MNNVHRLYSRLLKAAMILLSAAAPFVAAAPTAEPAKTPTAPIDMLGEAVRQDTRKLLYQEHHQYATNARGQLEHQVTYTQPDGTAWATKAIFYNGRETAPSFELTDTLNNESLKVTVKDNAVTIARTIDGKTQKHQLSIKQPLVVDAGFDPFVRNNWQSLSNGNSETFYFLLPRREKLVELRLTPHTCKDFDPDAYLCLSLEINNWFLRMLVDPIELTYSRTGQQPEQLSEPKLEHPIQPRLTRYLGVSNLSFPNEDDTPQVDIRYSPAPQPTAN